MSRSFITTARKNGESIGLQIESSGGRQNYFNTVEIRAALKAFWQKPERKGAGDKTRTMRETINAHAKKRQPKGGAQ